MIHSMINWYFDYEFYLSCGMLLIWFSLDSKKLGWFFSYPVAIHLSLAGLSYVSHAYYCENDMNIFFLIFGISLLLAGISFFHKCYVLRLLKIIK